MEQRRVAKRRRFPLRQRMGGALLGKPFTLQTMPAATVTPE
jgi:hypothetical protein